VGSEKDKEERKEEKEIKNPVESRIYW